MYFIKKNYRFKIIISFKYLKIFSFYMISFRLIKCLGLYSNILSIQNLK
jgi:hypothetical protein